MSKTRRQCDDSLAILSKWEESLRARDGGNDRDRDSAILRFELAYEVIWKFVQQRVRENGFESNGPRQAFKNAFRLGWIDDEFVFSEILKSRNTAVHVYREEVADKLAAQLPAYHRAFSALVASAMENMDDD